MNDTQPSFHTLDLTLDPDLRCQSPVIQLALDHWRILRGTLAMPAPGELDALTIPRQVLPHISLVDIEYEPDKRFRWRLIGTAVTSTLRRDLTGRYWDEIYDGDTFELFAQPANAVLANAAPMRFTARAHVAGREFYDAEHIYMPLARADAPIERLFGVSIFSYATRGA